MLEKLKKEKPLPEIVADQMMEFIQTQHLQPGDKLPSEAELGNSLGVGRNTIREAIKILISKNIVIIKRGLGTYIAENMGVVEDPLGFRFFEDKMKLLHDTLDIRLILEPKIAEVAALSATDEEIEEMERLCNEVEMLIKNGENHIEKDIELHTQIAKSSKNLVVSKLLPIINGSIPIFIDVTKSALKNETITTHRAVVEAIKVRDAEGAFKAMQTHIMHNKEYIVKL